MRLIQQINNISNSLSARPECPVRGVSKGLIFFLVIFLSTSPGQPNPGLISYSITDIDSCTKEISINFIVPKKDFIYKDFITFSVDNPAISLSPWKANKPTVAHYDSSFKEAKQIFNEDVTITMLATNKAPEHCTAQLYCTYYRKSEKKINHMLFPLIFTAPEEKPEEIIEIADGIAHHATTLKPIKKNSSLDYYIATTTIIIHTIIASLRIDHKKYFAFLIFIILVLLSFFYLFKKELENHIILKEWIEIIISLLIGVSVAYMIVYFQKFTTSLTTILIADVTVLYAGIFYIRKSTKVQSKNLRTLCTFIGMLCICSVFLLSFKALQCADQQFNLLS